MSDQMFDPESVAREVVTKVVPHEAELFDQLWSDFLENPTTEQPVGAEGSGDHPHGFGAGEAALYVWTAVIIPVVVALAKDQVVKGVAWLETRVRKLIGLQSTGSGKEKAVEEMIAKISEAVAEAVQKRVPTSEGGPASPSVPPAGG